MKQENKPLVSIIVPCYNVDKYLDKCVVSLVNQTYRNLEILLVDDGSVDETSVLCDTWAERDARIRVIHKQNGGLVAARNDGFELATGDWVMYLDGDDWIDLDTCEKLIEAINRYSADTTIDVIFWKCIQELSDKSIKGKWEWPCQDKERLYVGDECKELARNVLIYKSGIATAYCKLIRADFAHKYALRHDSRLRQGMEGTEFSLRTFFYAHNALYINKYFNHYLFNPNSISKAINEKNSQYITDSIAVIEEDIETFNFHKNEFRSALYERVVYALIAIAMSTYFHPQNKESYIKRSCKFRKLIKENPIYGVSLKNANLSGLDRKRRLTTVFLKMRLFFLVDAISRLKQYYLKKGKFDY